MFDKTNPIRVFKNLKSSIEDLANFYKYQKIIFELQREGKLDAIGFSLDSDANLYLGINLNPELLLYSETSSGPAELKMIGEKMKRYTEFLTKEGILDFVKVEHDRIQTEAYYGYILQVKYDFKKYRRGSFIYGISYFLAMVASIATLILFLI